MVKSKVKHGKKDLLGEDEFDPQHTKVLISIRLDGRVIAAAKARAEAEGVGYQTILNRILEQQLLGTRTIEERIATLEALARPERRKRA